MLQFSKGPEGLGAGAVKKAEIVDGQRNEALIRIREKIRVKSNPGNGAKNQVAISSPLNMTAIGNPRDWTQHAVTPANANRPLAVNGKDPYHEYLANKTFLLPALSEQKKTYYKEKIEKVY